MVKNLKIQHVVLATVFFLFVLVNGQPITDTDTWWHLKVGEYIWHSGSVPRTDIFSFSNGNHPWITHEWLAEVIYYGAFFVAGLQGMFLVNLLLLTLTFYVFYKTVYLESGANQIISAVVVMVAVFFTFLFWVFRPHVFSHLLFVLVLYILRRFSKGQDYLWLLPLLSIFWVNVHGSFIMVPVLTALFLVGGLFNLNFSRIVSVGWSLQQKKKLLLTMVLSVGATLINPNTYKILLYPFQTIKSDSILKINEWLSPDFHKPYFMIFFAFMLVVFLIMGVSKQKHQLTDVLLLGFFAAMSMYAVRNIALFVFVSGPILGGYFAGFVRKANVKPDRAPLIVLNWLFLIAILVGTISCWPAKVPLEKRADAKVLPVQAVGYLQKHHFSGKVFNDYNWGGYLLWTMYPQVKVMVDGRTDVFADKVFPDYLTIYTLKGDAPRLLKAYDPDFLLIRKDSPLDNYLKQSKEWRRVYRDTMAIIYVPVLPLKGA